MQRAFRTRGQERCAVGAGQVHISVRGLRLASWTHPRLIDNEQRARIGSQECEGNGAGEGEPAGGKSAAERSDPNYRDVILDGRLRQALMRLNRDLPPEALDEEVDRLAGVLAGNAPVAMRGMKRTIHEIARGKLDEEAADRRHRDSMRGEEIKEGIKAFAEKRPPKF